MRLEGEENDLRVLYNEPGLFLNLVLRIIGNALPMSEDIGRILSRANLTEALTALRGSAPSAIIGFLEALFANYFARRRTIDIPLNFRLEGYSYFGAGEELDDLASNFREICGERVCNPDMLCCSYDKKYKHYNDEHDTYNEKFVFLEAQAR
jgi:hypothetical protein